MPSTRGVHRCRRRPAGGPGRSGGPRDRAHRRRRQVLLRRRRFKAISRGENLFHPDHPEWGFAGYVRHFVDKPTIAAVNGTALGGGTELALASDLVVAEERAKFGLPEVKRGLIAGAGGVFRIVLQLPQKLALELVYTGEPLSSADAPKWGLINKVVPDGTVLDAALELAERIAVNAPLPVGPASGCPTAPSTASPAADEPFWKQTFGEFATLLKTEDAQEGPMAFARSASRSGKRSNSEETGFRNRARAAPGDCQAVPGEGGAQRREVGGPTASSPAAYVAAGNYGLIGFNMPEEYGGGGSDDFRFNAVIVEEFSKFGGPARREPAERHRRPVLQEPGQRRAEGALDARLRQRRADRRHRHERARRRQRSRRHQDHRGARR